MEATGEKGGKKGNGRRPRRFYTYILEGRPSSRVRAGRDVRYGVLKVLIVIVLKLITVMMMMVEVQPPTAERPGPRPIGLTPQTLEKSSQRMVVNLKICWATGAS